MDKKDLCSHFNLLFIAYLLSSHYAYTCTASRVVVGRKGKWELLLNDTGVVAMHMALTHQNTVIMFETGSSGHLGYRMRRRYNGTPCRGRVQDSSCYSHSIEYDIARNKIRPLAVKSKTDSCCSSGSMLSNGTLIQTGGFNDGSRKIQYLQPCQDGQCDWRKGGENLSEERWYASSLKLPEDDRLIVVGGRRAFSYEFVPKRSSKEKSFNLPFLKKTYDSTDQGENNLYPIVHLSSDGHLFIFANRDSILFDYKRNKVVRKYPRIPGKGSRSYPSTGSSVILPLDHEDNFQKVEVMICGGAADGAFAAAKKGKFLKGVSSCGRMVITGKSNHKWRMERMPGPRLMNDMIILPTGHILIINGVKKGCAGWNYASDPSLEPYLYKPKKTLGRRFLVLKSTKIARMYHSSAVLLPSGRVLIGGSNPNTKNTSKKNAASNHRTELRLQAFVPGYMATLLDDRRAHNVTIFTGRNDESVGYGEKFSVEFMLRKMERESDLEFSVYASPFNTHSISMNQRMLILKCNKMVNSTTKEGWMRALVEAPPSPRVAPSGYYMLRVVNDGVPSTSQWVRFK